MTEEQRAAAAATPEVTTPVVIRRRYDPTALIGLIIAVAPDLTQELMSSDLGITPQWKAIVRVVGLFVAAYGRSLLFRKPYVHQVDPTAIPVVEVVQT